MSEKQQRILCYGELVVDCFGSPTEGFMPKFGGAPGNTAIGLAKLEKDHIAFTGKVGADFFGDFLDNALQSYGVDTTHLFRDEQHKSTLAFVSLGPNGERDFSFYAGAHEQVTKEEMEQVNFSDVRVMQFGSLTQSNDACRAATNHALAEARDNNVYISYDPNVREPLWPSLEVLKETILETMPKVDMMKINEEELRLLAETDDPKEGAATLWQDNFQLLLITLGAQGAYWKTATGEGLVSTAKIKPVDTTGAGDAFNAGMLSRLYDHIEEGKLNIEENELVDAVAFANRVASLSTLKKGAIEALPTLQEAERLH